jgi:hypothetical protein
VTPTVRGPEPLTGLVARWRQTATLLRDEGCQDAAKNKERCADELERCLNDLGNTALSVQEAARESGYSEEHVRRVLRERPALNCGRAGKPKIRRCDLPRKPAAVVRAGPAAYDPAADARSLMSRQGVT